MSLVPTYSILSDGKWYENPILAEDDWFICFDDDDPIELVIKESAYKEGLTATKIIEKLQIDGFIISRGRRMGRLFGKDAEKFKFSDAIAFFLVVNSPPPVEYLKKHDGVYSTRPKTEGCYYDYKRKIKKSSFNILPAL